jgi:NADH-quinone oxidoreductase subunit N
MTAADVLRDLTWMQPELLLAGFALAAALVGAWFGDKATGFLSGLAAVALVVAGAIAVMHRPDAPQVIFNGAFVVDGFSAYAKALIGFAAAATLVLGADNFAKTAERRFEFPILVTLAVTGMFVMVSANDLIALYIGVELQSLAAYVLAAFRRDDARSSEAGLKYFVLGALSSGLLLYGASLVYGFSGSVKFEAIAAAVAAGQGGAGLIFGLVFMLCGLAFKMSAAPFHMWTPDVYEGAPTPITAFFAAAPKAAAVALMARVLYGPFDQMTDEWRQVVVVLSGASMLIGSFAALAQTNIKRLMAYSSIANIGFVLMALAAGKEEGGAAALFYLSVYLPTTIGVFAIILAMKRQGQDLVEIADLSGLASRNIWMAAVLTALMFSLMGLPPLVGFWGKWFAFQAALSAGLLPLVIVGALCAVVAAAYYLGIIAKMWFAPPVGERFDGASGAITLTAGLAAALTLAFFVAAGAIFTAAQEATLSSFAGP